MRYLIAVVAALAFAGPAVAAELSDGYTKEVAGPREGQYRTFGWQDRERMTASTYDLSQFQGEGVGDGSAAAAGEAAAAAATAGEGCGTGSGASGNSR